MRYLFDGAGTYIANEVAGHLHAPGGVNIGHYLEREGIFIDMAGRYLGEVVLENTLMASTSSPYRSITYGSLGNVGSVGSCGSPGSAGGAGFVPGYEDILGSRLV